MGAWQHGRELNLKGPKQRTMFAALLLNGGEVVPDQQLTELLWGEAPPATSIAQIHTYASRIRRQLGETVSIDRNYSGYLMRVHDARIDLAEFEARTRFGRAALRLGRRGEGVRWLRSALALWRGPALSNVTEHLTKVEAPRLEEERLTVLSTRIEAELALGAHARMIPELVDLVVRYPLQESFRAQLMVAFHRDGRPEDALAVYENGRRLLAEELGIDPGPFLRSVYEALLSPGRAPTAAAGPLTYVEI
ncbi:AfsR/SARP family transcriptional regulator [Actinomadura algeriensis]|uniref:DNA-binding SARP family transcriptional activator n=1 Tax=Actinomadura algeriensis TaxID=1679523 RepID=A0ABR9JTK7_9ACTN|nr:AfsR/SARP family transcriptional regulator [Actinomadura algeriensis]MBE1533897.1 DNA-binding SARP family transcriptional activator [Actinomadura algeriensis]